MGGKSVPTQKKARIGRLGGPAWGAAREASRAAPMTAPPLSLRLFGPLRIRVGTEPLPRVRTRSVEWLLALLVLRRGGPVSRGWLAGTLWPESEESRALQNLRCDLVRLRQALRSEEHTSELQSRRHLVCR